MSAPAIDRGYWWVSRTDGSGREIVLVTGTGVESTQTVEFIRAGFSSVARAKEKGFVFEQRVQNPEEAK
ncbi:hypothetical protein [Bradyrhizobium sp. Bra64]|uniref:hypothetical protein n=1 Tax=Bradyrhizobium sp. Bra64 TaxID=2926009 RepID=UPI00211839E2|nr:hypothetical protein [Bradyrhizobium sp. Bra64]